MNAPKKRGRPAKNAPIYDDDRNIIITSEEHEAINEIVEDISRSVKKVETIYKIRRKICRQDVRVI